MHLYTFRAAPKVTNLLMPGGPRHVAHPPRPLTGCMEEINIYLVWVGRGGSLGRTGPTGKAAFIAAAHLPEPTPLTFAP